MKPASLRSIRQYLLGIVATYERELGDVLTTAEMRKWFKAFGPTPEEAKRMLDKK